MSRSRSQISDTLSNQLAFCNIEVVLSFAIQTRIMVYYSRITGCFVNKHVSFVTKHFVILLKTQMGLKIGDIEENTIDFFSYLATISYLL